jgi:opacity protein-like surface antigen
MLASAASAPAGGLGVRVGRVSVPDTDEDATTVGAFLRSGRALGFEGAIDYRSEDLAGGGELRTWPVTASLVLSPVPLVHALAGVGWYNTTLEFPAALNIEKKTESKLGWHVGGGAQVPLFAPVSVVGDLRYAYIDYDFGDAVDAVADFDGGNYFALQLGAMLQFP